MSKRLFHNSCSVSQISLAHDNNHTTTAATHNSNTYSLPVHTHHAPRHLRQQQQQTDLIRNREKTAMTSMSLSHGHEDLDRFIPKQIHARPSTESMQHRTTLYENTMNDRENIKNRLLRTQWNHHTTTKTSTLPSTSYTRQNKYRHTLEPIKVNYVSFADQTVTRPSSYNIISGNEKPQSASISRVHHRLSHNITDTELEHRSMTVDMHHQRPRNIITNS
jgi:hypothetical protein